MSTARLASAAVLLCASCTAVGASAQAIVYRPVVTMFAPAAGPFVANYTPAGNYAAVSAYSPPIFETVAMPVAVAPVATPVTAFYAPTFVAPTYAPPAPVATTSFYAPVAPAMVAAPVTAYYAPAAVAVPLYRRGPLGAYRPVRTAFYPSY
ncbi:MAG: hypothetical protein EBZ74_04415 [Planctomycetia bacterium]|nr:hypothetical protein [Planctomycetia bacterium]